MIGIERFVYTGYNVLWEMRGPGSASSTPAEVDQAVGTGQEYGAIGYTHAGGVDRPLAAYKLGTNAAVIAPYTNWRGQFSGGTYLQGSQSTAPVSWPGYSTTAWYQGKPPQEQNRVYMGTLLEGQRDASGQMYMRNRMYDPATGQFTQTDPIGIAGGLNTYGFAAGDPITYSDSYGLCPPKLLCDLIGATAGEEATQHWAEVANNSTGVKKVLATGAGLFSALWTPDTYQETATTLAAAAGAGAAVRSARVPADVSPRTPVGHRGKPLQVHPGTNSPATIGGRRYSGHSLDRMQERGLTPTVVDDVIQHGTRTAGRDPGTFVHTGDGVKVVTNRRGDVVTVMQQ